MDNFRLDGKKSANYYATLYSNISFLLGEEKERKSSVCIPLDTSLSSLTSCLWVEIPTCLCNEAFSRWTKRPSQGGVKIRLQDNALFL